MSRKSIPHIDEKIIKEIFKEANKGGIAGVSTLTIARRLNISEPVIFAHFKTKRNLLEAAFTTAWNSYPHVAPIPTELSYDDKETCFARYKEKVSECMKHPLEIRYINSFMNSPFYPSEAAKLVEKPFFEEIKSMFARSNSSIDDHTLSLLAERFIESSLVTLNHLLSYGDKVDEETLRTYFNVRVYGFVGTLHMDFVDKALKKISSL